MSKRASVRRIGLFMLGAIAIAVGGIVLLGWARFFRDTLPFVLHFEGSVHGLRPGAPVRFKGVDIGRVIRMELPRQVIGEEIPIPVIVELDAQLVLREDGGVFDRRRDLAGAVARGLRGSLEIESLLTGILFVSLDFDPGHEGRFYGGFHDIPEIPTVPTRMQALQAQAQDLVGKLAELDLSGFLGEMRRVAAQLGELTQMPELRSAIVSLDEALRATSSLAGELEQEVGPVSDELRATLVGVRAAAADFQGTVVQARGTLERIDAVAARVEQDIDPLMTGLGARIEGLGTLGEDFARTLEGVRELLDPRAPLSLLLADALGELARASRAVRDLARTVERDPAVLLRGRREGR